ncbi:putative amidohydrolase family protein [Diaporthe ampelina]|uniref:Putative amidohydrolase family protein n=1 Tax=Diaporthe ampelina TaxID=1214573 RepID=A0A0G2F8B0_9PEZI|nr:putative amidohydrolase family protein [Diaporthe ampelina]
MASSPILLKGDTLLIHDNDDNVVPTRADLLNEGDRITGLGVDASPPVAVAAQGLAFQPHAGRGQLAGAMESVDAGTITVVGHSHLNLGPNYREIPSTSGLRTVYCYCPPWRTSSFSPLKLEEDPVPSSDTRDAFAALASPAKPHGNGRVTLGFAQDNIYLPPAKLQSIYARVRGGGGTGRAQLITTHAQGGPAFGSRPPAMSILGGGCA